MVTTPQNYAARRRHDLLADVAEHTALRLVKKHGMAEDVAADIGNDLADWMADHFGGQNVYFVKDEGYKLNERDLSIFNEIERGNAYEIAAKHGLSYVRVYQIYKRVLTELRKQTQPRLFTDG